MSKASDYRQKLIETKKEKPDVFKWHGEHLSFVQEDGTMCIERLASISGEGALALAEWIKENFED